MSPDELNELGSILRKTLDERDTALLAKARTLVSEEINHGRDWMAAPLVTEAIKSAGTNIRALIEHVSATPVQIHAEAPAVTVNIPEAKPPEITVRPVPVKVEFSLPEQEPPPPIDFGPLVEEFRKLVKFLSLPKPARKITISHSDGTKSTIRIDTQ